MGRSGELIVAAMSVVLLGSALNGGWLYRRQFWRGLLVRVRWRDTSARLRWADVHGVVGVWPLVLNVVLGATGFWLTRAVWSREFFHAAPPVTNYPPAPRPLAGYNTAMAIVMRAWPDFVPVGLSAITAPTDDYQVYGRLVEEPRVFGDGASEITIDGSSGRIKETRFLRDRPFVERLSIAAGPLHFAQLWRSAGSDCLDDGWAGSRDLHTLWCADLAPPETKRGAHGSDRSPTRSRLSPRVRTGEAFVMEDGLSGKPGEYEQVLTNPSFDPRSAQGGGGWGRNRTGDTIPRME